MKARIAGYYSTDLEGSPDEFRPPERTNFGYWLTLLVTIADQDTGEDQFEIFVCTTGYLEQRTQHEPIILGQHLLIVRRHDFAAILDLLRGRIESLEADSWDALGLLINSMARWENITNDGRIYR